MAPLLDRLRQSVGRHGLWAPGARVLAAVSGGSDSVALLFLLQDLAAEGAVTLAGLAHLHHRIRPEADDDAAFCRALAARLRIPAEMGEADVPALARAAGSSLEVAGHKARYEFLERAADRCGADRVAVAHTRDDQAETVLLRVMRGSGTAGLRGILPVRGRVVRPLLDCSRAELQAYLTSRGERWRDDTSNADLRTPRNRVRHELLPYLRTHFAPGIDAVLSRTAEVARVEEALLAALAEEAFRAVARVNATQVAIETGPFGALPEALRRRVARLALETAGGPRSYGLEEALAVVEACLGPSQAPMDLPGLRMERSGPGVVLLIKGRRPHPPPVRTACPLAVPGEAWLDDGGPGVTAALAPAGGLPDPRTPAVALVAADRIAWPLTVRTRQPGDTLRPCGLGGRKKLQDLFVDRKVPRAERDRVPVVVDTLGRVVWVAGHALDEAFRVTDPSGTVVVLKLVPSRK
jgi:tRNA(Ile)-lysidine synthase